MPSASGAPASEPPQRMVVVRRRKRRRSHRASRAERLIARARIALLAVIGLALVAKLIGLPRIAAALDTVRSALRPLKSSLKIPDLGVFLLILVALGLVYTMPNVQRRVNRALGIGRKRD